MTKTSEKVAVEQVDREAFAAVAHGWWRNLIPEKIAEFALEGMLDSDELVQAFARHRLRTPEPTEPVVWMYAHPKSPDRHFTLTRGRDSFPAEKGWTETPLCDHPPTGVERAQVVAWLRGPAFTSRHPEDAAFARHVANAIERGEHLSASPSAESGADLRKICETLTDDYMTSEAHHPGYVLIPTAKFEAIRAALFGPTGDEPLRRLVERAKEIIPDHQVNWHADANESLAALSTVADQGEGDRQAEIIREALRFPSGQPRISMEKAREIVAALSADQGEGEKRCLAGDPGNDPAQCAAQPSGEGA